uniref:ADP-ribosylation factor interacting protein 2b n=1 Tax=Seriola dumerili TaxID=41447 RepID=A0A3B4UID4_SERDU
MSASTCLSFTMFPCARLGFSLRVQHAPQQQQLSMTAEELPEVWLWEKLETMKKWGLNTYKVSVITMISERFGRGSRDCGPELEAQIEVLRDTKRKYEKRPATGQSTDQPLSTTWCRRKHALGEPLLTSVRKSPELRSLLCKTGRTLLGAINFFVSSINTLVNQDHGRTPCGRSRCMKNARSEYWTLFLGPRDAVAMARIDAAQQQYQVHKEKYERLRSDVIINSSSWRRIRFILCWQQQQLEQTLKQFNIKLAPPGADKPPPEMR